MEKNNKTNINDSITLQNSRRLGMMNNMKLGTFTVLFLLVVAVLWAKPLTGGAASTLELALHEFFQNTTASALEVNDNFVLVKEAVNDNDSRISSLESGAFILNQNETVTGRPSFNGGTSGSTPPFYVDSNYRISNLNADYLDGYHASSFSLTSHTHSSMSGLSKKAGYIYNGWSGTVSSTTQVLVGSVYVGDTYSKDVSINAHVVLEASTTSSGGRYEVVIRRGGSSGTIVGQGWWRPPVASGYHAETISFTGFDNNISGAYTYYLYARKYDSGAPNAGIGPRGLTVDWVQN